MPADFKSIISSVKQAHEEFFAPPEDPVSEEQAARAKMIAEGVALLKKRVAPLLENARAAFAAEDVHSEIVDDFEPAPRFNLQPSLTFKCIGPERSNKHGGISQPHSIPIFFRSDGQTFSIGLGSYDGSNAADNETEGVPIDQVEEAVGEAIKLVATSYYESLGKLRQSGLWD